MALDGLVMIGGKDTHKGRLDHLHLRTNDCVKKLVMELLLMCSSGWVELGFLGSILVEVLINFETKINNRARTGPIVDISRGYFQKKFA